MSYIPYTKNPSGIAFFGSSTSDSLLRSDSRLSFDSNAGRLLISGVAVSTSGHQHQSSDITNFASSVSGLISVKGISAGTGIVLSSNGDIFTINVSGNFGLTGEEVDDRVGGLLIGNSGISLTYDDLNNRLFISTSGLQPSGNYSIVGHSHTSSNITDFNSSVSELVSGIYAPLNSPTLTGIPLTPTAASGTNTNQIASTAFVRNELSNLVDSAPSILDTLNELASALGDDANFSTTVTNLIAEKVSKSGDTMTGNLYGPSGYFTNLFVNNVPVSVSGHSHLISDIIDFASGVENVIDTALIEGQYINIVYDSGVNTVTISATGLQPSGNYAASLHNHLIVDISGLQTALDSKQPSGNYSLIGHTHTSNNITDFNSSVSGLLPLINNSGNNRILTSTGSSVGIDAESNLIFDGSVLNVGGIIKIQNDVNILDRYIRLGDDALGGEIGLTFTSETEPADHCLAYYVNKDGSYRYGGTYGDESFIITSGGYCGIRNYTPAYNLDVIGTGNFSQNLLVNNIPVSLSGHTHTSSDISNFNNSVSGLVSGIYAPLDSPTLTGVPLTPTAISGTNTNQIASTAFVRTEISNLVNSAPSTLDTLNELAAALGNDANFSTTVTNSLAGKANLSGAIFTGAISGPSGDFTTLKQNGINVSISGHTHISLDIIDFNTSVSGLLPTVANSGDNKLLTSTGSTVGINAENNLTFDGSLLSVSGNFIAQTGTINALNFNNIGDPDLSIGELAWNDTESSLSLGLSNNYSMFLGGELHYRIRNNTGSTLLAGTAVYATGLTPGGNNRIEIAPKTADGSTREVRFMGLMTENCDTGQNGFTTHFGYIRGIDTRGDAATNGTTNKLWTSGEPIWSEGDILYVHPTEAGKLTKIEPKHSISVAIILNRSQNQGKLFVRPTSYGHLNDNHDVNTSGAIDGQFLQYNSSIDYWTPSSSGNFTNLQVNGTGVSLNGHNHTSSNITDFSSSVSGLFPTNLITGVGTSGYVSRWNGTNSLTSGVIFDNSSSIGIGTITPSGRLDVAGDVYVRGTANNFGTVFFKSSAVADNILKARADQFGNLYFEAGTSPYLKLGNQDGAAVLKASASSVDIGHSYARGGAGAADQHIKFTPSNTERVRITNVGRVGIGTSSPSYSLDVVGTGNFSQNLLVNGTGVSVSGHNHISSEITNFGSSVSGLLNKNIAFFTAMNNQPPASNFATLDTNNSIVVLDFDDTSEESAVFLGVIPNNSVLTSGLSVRLNWAATTATSGNCRWGVQFEKMNTSITSDSFDTATEDHSATNATSGIPTITTLNCTSIDSLSQGDFFRMKIYRDCTDTTNDTMTGDAELISIEIRSIA